MPTSRRSGIRGPTLSNSELERGRAALRAIEDLLPLSEVSVRVRDFFRRETRAQLAASLGNPLDLLSDAPPPLRTALTEILARGAGEHDDEFIGAEAETARAAIARHWVNGVLEAWHLGVAGGADRMALTSALLPDLSRSDSEVADEWRAGVREDEQALFSTLAIPREGLPDLLAILARAALSTLERGPLELPDGLCLRRVEGGVAIERRP